ncbi:MAG: ATPase, T2SS/T4P/T4SS family [bacterium]
MDGSSGKVRHTILCIDDDKVTLKVTERMLTAGGYEVIAADSGRKGLQVAREIVPDLILLDITMPEIDGYEVCAMLRTSVETASVPVVFLTASAEEQDRARAFALGAIDYLTKPVTGGLLLEKVRLYLRTTSEWREMDQEATHWSENIQQADFLQFKEFISDRLNLDGEGRYRLSSVGWRDLYSASEDLGVNARAMAQNVAEFLKVPYVCNINPDDIRLGVLPISFSKSNSIVATGNASGQRAYVLSNPFDLDLVELLRKFAYFDRDSRLMITEPSSIAALFVEPPSVPEVEVLPNEREKPEPKRHVVSEHNGPQVQIHSKRAESEVVEYPVVQICNTILHTAVSERASDIHVEPKETNAVVRLRVDGDMRDLLTLKKITGMKLVSRLKILGDLDIAEKRKPQDGAFAAVVSGRTFNIRLSTTYTPNGESIVMRLLEPYSEAKDLSQLGMAGDQVSAMRDLLARNKGMLVVVGPTGSGKTTTIYSLLHEIDHRSLSIMSVEDPVEYRIPFVNQHQVNDRAGVTFKSLLKTAVRQDPDVLFVGEIRDNYSAKAALDFASTGHLTISSLHTADATSAIFRLERLGVERGAMADSIVAIVAQRLVRRLCDRCAEIVPVSDDDRKRLARYTGEPPATVGRPVGCQNCNYTGYFGREGVFEVLRFDPEVAAMVRGKVAVQQIRSHLSAKGTWLMSDHGVSKARAHILSPADLYECVLSQDADAAESPQEIESTPRGATTPRGAQNGALSEAPGPTGPAVLVVDDDAESRKTLMGILRKAGCDVSACVDGVEALLSLGKKEFDLVIAGAEMSDMDGFRLIEMIRDKGLEVPVILVSSSGDPADEQKGLQAGAADFVRKPIDGTVMALRARRVVESSRLVKAL